MEKETYYDIAMSDRLWAKYSYGLSEELGYYNNTIISLQQCAEKYLKGFITNSLNYNGKYDKELKTHNLRLLANIINQECEVDLNSKDAKYLGDFYFDARYPGDNFERIIDKSIAEECFQICDSIIATLTLLINKEE